MNNADMPAMPITSDLIRPACGESLPHAFPYSLTKREYFAGLVMPQMVAECHPDGSPVFENVQQVAQAAVRQADALLDELEKQS